MIYFIIIINVMTSICYRTVGGSQAKSKKELLIETNLERYDNLSQIPDICSIASSIVNCHGQWVLFTYITTIQRTN